MCDLSRWSEAELQKLPLGHPDPLTVILTIHLAVYLAIHLAIHLAVHLAIHLDIQLAIHLIDDLGGHLIVANVKMSARTVATFLTVGTITSLQTSYQASPLL